MPDSSQDFTRAFLSGELERFFRFPGEAQAPLAATVERPRRELAAGLRAEAERLAAPEAVFQRIRRLEHPASRVVVTGQQAGLLLGPNYSLIKAHTAIRLAAELDRPHAPVIPVFWLASQDHDTAEVDHTWLLDLNEQIHKVSIDLPSGTPISSIPWDPDWLGSIQEQLARAVFPAEFRAESSALLAEAAAGAQWYGDFFVRQLYLLLGEHSPVVLDPARPGLASLFQPVLANEIKDPGASVRLINEAGNELRRLGFTPQLGRAADATDLFITEQVDGLPRRKLLRRAGEQFVTVSRTYSQADLLAILRAEPARITPAAGLRPVTQDAVLPSSVFVVGPGELRYLAQLLGVYEHHGVAQPVIRLRAAATIIEPPVRRILARYGLSAADYQEQRQAARETVLLQRAGHAERFAEALERIESEGAELFTAVAGIDPTLKAVVSRQQEQLTSGLKRLQSRTAAALGAADSVTSRQFDRLETHLFPCGTPQERFLSPWSFFLKFGTTPVLKLLLGLPPSGVHHPEI